MYVVAQLFAMIGLTFIFIGLQQNNKKKILVNQFVANLSYTFQYFCLNAISGGLVCMVATIRSFVFNFYSKDNKKIPFYVFLIFSIISLTFGFFSYNNIIDLIPISSSILYTFGIWQNNLKIFRYISGIVAILWTIYNFISYAFIAMIGSLVELLASIVSIYKFDIKNKNK